MKRRGIVQDRTRVEPQLGGVQSGDNFLLEGLQHGW
jgi:hypothetical protein